MKDKFEKLFVQLVKFSLVGVIATLIELILFYLLTNLFNIHYMISAVLGFSISALFNYYASIKFVFDVNKDKKATNNFLFFIVFSIIGLLLNELILFICIERFGLYDVIAKILATFVVMIFNFITRKLFLE